MINHVHDTMIDNTPNGELPMVTSQTRVRISDGAIVFEAHAHAVGVAVDLQSVEARDRTMFVAESSPGSGKYIIEIEGDDGRVVANVRSLPRPDDSRVEEGFQEKWVKVL